MSIVRIGLAETQSYSDGWNSIFSRSGAKSPPGKPKAAKKSVKARPKPKPNKSKK